VHHSLETTTSSFVMRQAIMLAAALLHAWISVRRRRNG
jgi:hypothetical protein